MKSKKVPPAVAVTARPDPRDAELARLIQEIDSCVVSARTVAATGSAAERRREIDRLRRMLAAWRDLSVAESSAKDHDARMFFVEHVVFLVEVTRQSDARNGPEDGGPTKNKARESALFMRAEQLIANVLAVAPAAARRLDLPRVARLIDRWANGRRPDWKLLAQTWGVPSYNSDRWQSDWSRWRTRRSVS